MLGLRNCKLIVCYGNNHKNFPSATDIGDFLASDEVAVGFNSGGWRLSPLIF